MNLKQFMEAMKQAGSRAADVLKQAIKIFKDNNEADIRAALLVQYPDFKENAGGGAATDPNANATGNKSTPEEIASIVAAVLAGRSGGAATDPNANANPVVDPNAAPASDAKEVRSIAILNLCEIAGRMDELATYLKSTQTVEEVRADLLKKREDNNTPVGDATSQIIISKDEKDNYRDFAVGNLMLRAGFPEKEWDKFASNIKLDDIKKTNGRGLKLMDFARRSYEIQEGHSATMVDPEVIIKRALGHSTGDFTNALADVANKFAAIGYEEARTTYQEWTGRGSIPDFKPQNVIQLSGFTDLKEIPEGEAAKQITMSDAKETATLKTFGGVWTISRNAIINDDLMVFSRAPRMIAVAGRRKINDLAYGILTDNDNLADGTALFDAGHSNVGTGGVVSNTTIGEGVKLLRRQTDPKSNILNLFPRFFIGPATIETTALSVLRGDLPIIHTKATETDVWRGRFATVFDAVLDESSTTKWYMTADPTLIDTVTIFFLNGNDAPIMTEADALIGQPLGRSFQILIDVVAKAIDHRGMMENAGV